MVEICSKCGNKNILKISKQIEGKRIAFNCKGKECGQRIEVDIPLPNVEINHERKTQIISSQSRDLSRAILTLTGNEKHPPLALMNGVNVIGRKSVTSQANIQIEVKDQYMSRMHTVIVVTKHKGQTEYLLKDYDSKNNTKLNGTPLRKGEEIYLISGDRISLGQTSLHFKIL